jgi:glycosyltransferase A (GT-A) superfamily protein (DUF2064 family)
MNSAAAAPPCLVVMLKQPGHSKRRLVAEIGALGRLAAEHLWACALEDARSWTGPVCFAIAEPGDRAWLLTEFPTAPLILEQGSGNLGQRINRIDEALRRAGYTQLLFMGTDCPALSLRYLEEASRRLGEHEVVLGPALDGGVVLMGSRRTWPDLEPLPWSTAALGDALARTCAARGDRISWQPALADVDVATDLQAAGAALDGDPRPARRAFGDWVARHADPRWFQP